MPLSDYDPIFQAAGREWNVDPMLLKAVAQQETGGKLGLVSSAGAQGLMQIMPDTQKDLGVTNPNDPAQSIYGAAKYLSQLLDKYQKPEAALAAYNAGPKRIDDVVAGRAQLPAETAAYVPAVASHYRQFAASVAPTAPSQSGGDLGSVMSKLRSGGSAAPASDQASMSDADFLKATGGPGAPKLDDDATFLAKTGGKAPEGTPSGQSVPGYDATAEELTPSPPKPANDAEAPGATDRILGAAVQGAKEGFGDQPLGLGQPAVNALQQSGIYPPAAGGGSILQNLNQAVISPLAAGADLALRGGSAAFRGGQALVAQSGAELGQPALGRDLAAMPEAFMGSPVRMMPPEAVPAPANRLMPEAAPAAPPPVAAPVIANGGPAFVPPNALAPKLPRILDLIRQDDAVAASRPDFVPPNAPQPPLPAGNPLAQSAPPQTAANPLAGAPNSVGAAATPSNMTPMGAREAAASQATGEAYNLLKPAKEGVDTTEYVPGVKPTTAEVAGNAATSIKQKVNSQQNPEPYRQQQAANNEARIQYFEDAAGTPTIINRLTEARSDQAKSDLQAAFSNKQPTDAQPVVDTINGILTNPRDKENTAVQQYVKPLLARLQDSDGALKADPEQLYGLREDVTRMLSKTARAETPTLDHVTGQLQAIKGALDDVIERGAPGYQQYLQNFATASKPIDEMQVLQDYRPKLTDASGNMTLGRFSTMMKNIVSDRQAGGVNQAKSISDGTMDRLFNIQSDLKRLGNIDLGKPRGADTFSNLLEYGKQGIVHGAANALAGPLGNLIVPHIMSGLRESAAKRTTRNLLAPDPRRYPPAGP